MKFRSLISFTPPITSTNQAAAEGMEAATECIVAGQLTQTVEDD